MAIAPFLAMTAAEIFAASSIPPKIAWMACHFSPYGLGLSNLPKELPYGSLLMVDDITPPHMHHPQLIFDQLAECVEQFRCSAVLLDFQRRNNLETQSIAKCLSSGLPCPTIVSESYASNLACPVFLPLLVPSMPLEDYLRPWKGRDVWLELGAEGEIITLTEQGADVCPLLYPDSQLSGFQDEVLCCHYSAHVKKESAGFTIWRTKEDFEKLLEKAEALGIAGAIGLYQELRK